MNPLVAFQVTFLGEAFATSQAAVWPLSGVDPSVGLEVAKLGEAATAEGAAERPLARVSLQVGLQVAGVGEAFSALAAAQEVPGASVRVRVWMVQRVGVMRVCRVKLGFDADPRGASSVICWFVTQVNSLDWEWRRKGGFGCGGNSVEGI